MGIPRNSSGQTVDEDMPHIPWYEGAADIPGQPLKIGMITGKERLKIGPESRRWYGAINNRIESVGCFFLDSKPEDNIGG